MFGKKGEVKVVPETQREMVVRAVGEVNTVLLSLDPKPKISFDPATGAIELALPEQMPDEALALPAPNEAGSDAMDTTETEKHDSKPKAD